MEELLFISKKILSSILQPVGLVLVLWLAGMVAWRRKLGSRMAYWFLLAAGILLLVMSFPITSFLLISPLEKQAGPYADIRALKEAEIRYIVVLGGGSGSDRLSPADRVGGGLFRVMEGTRIWQGIPETRLVLSGMGFPVGRTKAESMEALPRQLGVPKTALELETRAWDTRDEARFFSQLVGNDRFALVTSAYHIPRAMKDFEAMGLKPIPAPCEFKAHRLPEIYEWFLPDSDALRNVQLALHEYFGIMWLLLRNK